MKNRTENISVRYRPQHLTKSLNNFSAMRSYFFVCLLSVDIYGDFVCKNVLLTAKSCNTIISVKRF